MANVPGKMISWPNKGFRHRVEQGSISRRLLGPMVLDAASGSLLGVGKPFTLCYTGYECLSASSATSTQADADIYVSICPIPFSSYNPTSEWAEWEGLRKDKYYSAFT